MHAVEPMVSDTRARCEYCRRINCTFTACLRAYVKIYDCDPPTMYRTRYVHIPVRLESNILSALHTDSLFYLAIIQHKYVYICRLPFVKQMQHAVWMQDMQGMQLNHGSHRSMLQSMPVVVDHHNIVRAIVIKPQQHRKKSHIYSGVEHGSKPGEKLNTGYRNTPNRVQ